jgi:phospholipase C
VPRRFIQVAIALVIVLAWQGPLLTSDSSANPPSTPQATTPLEHIVLIFKENRSFDHYFGKFPGANGATQGEMHDGTIIDLVPGIDPMPVDPGHQTGDWLKAYNNGDMNGFDLEKDAFLPNHYPIVYSQMDESQIPNYWAYARRYGLADNFFADYQGASFANNLFRYSAQTGREDPSTGSRAAIGLPGGFTREGRTRWGCDLPPDFSVQMQAPNRTTSSALPCFSFEALPNLLGEFGVSWKTYADPNNVTFAHVTIDAIAQVRYNPSLWANVVPFEQFETDAAAGNLPAVSFVQSTFSDHPAESSVCDGENQAVELINAALSGPDANTTAIIMNWDEWGGFYDHVAPPIVDDLSYGFRVPALVISPWVKYGGGSDGGYISSTFYSHGSPLKLIETNWGLPALNSRDAGANDMLDFFDFQQTPKPPLILSPRTCPPATPEWLKIHATYNRDNAD